MKTEPNTADDQTLAYPAYICWEYVYPDGQTSHGACQVADESVWMAVTSLLEYEAGIPDHQGKLTVLKPYWLMQQGELKYCPTHGPRRDYKYCTDCGQPSPDLPVIRLPVAAHFCPEHGDQGESSFCGECGRKLPLSIREAL
ncbi:MAG: hypothetical protein PHC70_04360 [Patescibacteria group bacterium]|nr:hypothetical protein [Patescibacteria group bacterium]